MGNYLKTTFVTAWQAFLFFLPSWALAQSYDFASGSGLETTADAAGFTEKLKNLQPESLAAQIISQILAWLGVLFLGLTIYSGIVWMTAEGNEQKIEKAKTILIASISGLVVVIAAYAISYFVVNFFTGSSV